MDTIGGMAIAPPNRWFLLLLILVLAVVAIPGFYFIDWNRRTIGLQKTHGLVAKG